MKTKKSKVARFKIQRRLLTELPGLGKVGALERKPYPPGEHGLKRKKYSDYGLRLEEKQKVLAHYGLREEQFRRMIKKAKSESHGDWVPYLISLLERRLDNLVFRLGFAFSIAAARQLVSHGKVLVNGKKLDISSAILKEHDQITLKEEAYENQVFLQADQAPRLPLPEFLRKEEKGKIKVGILHALPQGTDIPFAFDAALLTEYYSIRGV